MDDAATEDAWTDILKDGACLIRHDATIGEKVKEVISTGHPFLFTEKSVDFLDVIFKDPVCQPSESSEFKSKASRVSIDC